MDTNIFTSISNANLLEKPANGQGGFQNLIRRLQDGYTKESGIVEMTHQDHDRIIKAIDSYGQGGWQDRLLKVFFS